MLVCESCTSRGVTRLYDCTLDNRTSRKRLWFIYFSNERLHAIYLYLRSGQQVAPSQLYTVQGALNHSISGRRLMTSSCRNARGQIPRICIFTHNHTSMLETAENWFISRVMVVVFVISFNEFEKWYRIGYKDLTLNSQSIDIMGNCWKRSRSYHHSELHAAGVKQNQKCR